MLLHSFQKMLRWCVWIWLSVSHKTNRMCSRGLWEALSLWSSYQKSVNTMSGAKIWSRRARKWKREWERRCWWLSGGLCVHDKGCVTSRRGYNEIASSRELSLGEKT
jgi:hypothetical protein